MIGTYTYSMRMFATSNFRLQWLMISFGQTLIHRIHLIKYLRAYVYALSLIQDNIPAYERTYVYI